MDDRQWVFEKLIRMKMKIRTRAAIGLLAAFGVVSPTSVDADEQDTATTNRAGARQQRVAVRFPTEEVKYQLGPDSQRKEGVPRGKVLDFDWTNSTVFAGTIRHCSIYVPTQYDGSKPAALMVFQDGHTYQKEDGDFRVPVVFDNLIAAKEMPIAVAVFIDPGFKQKEFPNAPRGWQPQPQNRSFEYDSLSTNYSAFLIDEILPFVRKEYKLNITDNPEGHAICGISSGAICAWTVAWHRPDQFRKVVSHVGSFTNIRGGNAWPDIIRTNDWKPIRILIQDGANDLRSSPQNRRPGWNWVIANHNLAAALEEKDYDYKYVFGEGGHNGNHGGVIFPDTMRWLWRDYPK
jgi:enterochelin esterase family protein